MPKHKQLFILILLAFSIIFVGEHFPSAGAQDPNAALAPLLTKLPLASLLGTTPTTLLSLAQILLLGRLINRMNGGDDDDDDDGLFGLRRLPMQGLETLGNKKKNMMFFLGRHNIQVSNNQVKKDASSEEDDDDDDDDDEDEDSGKKKKYKPTTTTESPDPDYDYDEEDVKKSILKQAIKQQYPHLKPSQIYWPEASQKINSDPLKERKENNGKQKPPIIVGVPPGGPIKGAKLPVFKIDTFSDPPLNQIPKPNHFPPSPSFKIPPASLQTNHNFDGWSDKEIPEPNSPDLIHLEEEYDDEENWESRRVSDVLPPPDNKFENRVGFVPPQRKNRTAKLTKRLKDTNFINNEFLKLILLLNAKTIAEKRRQNSTTPSPETIKSPSNQNQYFYSPTPSYKYMDANQYKKMISHSIEKMDCCPTTEATTDEPEEAYSSKSLHTTVQVISNPLKFANFNLGLLRNWFKLPSLFRRSDADRRIDQNDSNKFSDKINATLINENNSNSTKSIL